MLSESDWSQNIILRNKKKTILLNHIFPQMNIFVLVKTKYLVEDSAEFSNTSIDRICTKICALLVEYLIRRVVAVFYPNLYLQKL